MIRIHKGALLEVATTGKLDTIMHGCNCWHGSDSGIAGAIWDRFPSAYHRKLENHEDGAWGVLGTISVHNINEQRVQTWAEGLTHPIIEMEYLKKPFRVINAYTQYNGGADFYMSALVNILKHLNEHWEGKTIGIPKIGCGIGGGNWEEVENALLTHAPNVNWEVYVL